MALTQVQLPTIYNTAAGTLKVYLFHNDSITDLVYPTMVTFVNIDEIVETIDIPGGTTLIDNVDVTIMEDYNVHAEGFWHKLINGYDYDFELMFTLMEETDETFLFRGKLYRTNVDEGEYYLDNLTGTPSSVVRGVKFKLVSSLKVLEEVTVTDLITECTDHYVVIGGHPYIKIQAVLASMIKLAYGIAYNVDLLINNSTDFLFSIDTTPPSYARKFNDTYIYWTTGGYFDSTQSYAWVNRFADAFELLGHLCKMFGLIPRYTFGTAAGLIDSTPANNTHRIILNSRGRFGSTITMSGKLRSSHFVSDTPRKAGTMRATETQDRNQSYWYLKDVLEFGTPPPFAEFDVDLENDFHVSMPTGSGDEKRFLYNNDEDAMTDMEYWNYATNGYSTLEDDGSHNNLLSQGIVQYLFNRFPGGRVEYEREYMSIKAVSGTTDSQRNLQTLARHTIHDGATSRNFYASEVRKDITTNKACVVWVEE
jgi:hypothetical protein